jgi:hypothetical protein
MRNPKVIVSIILSIIVITAISVLLMTVGKTVGQSLFGRGFAESQLRDYVQAVLRQEVNGARCQAVDTDGNGYVSCDYTTMSQPNSPRSIECSAWGLDGFLNRGCKSRLPGFPTSNNRASDRKNT